MLSVAVGAMREHPHGTERDQAFHEGEELPATLGETRIPIWANLSPRVFVLFIDEPPKA